MKKYNKKIILLVAVVLLASMLFACICGCSKKEEAAQTFGEADGIENLDIDMTEVSTLEMRGMWIASVSNINYPSKQGLSVDKLKWEIDGILLNAHELGINSLFFQVRPTADALYDSDIFPASKYVSGTQGQTVEDFDILKYLLERAKLYNIDVHAWVNPYRVTMNEEDFKNLADNHPAKLHPEYTVTYADGKTYFNPGLPEVRQLIVSGVSELVTKYPELSGIHYDDYFYPYPSGNAEFEDEEAYAAYGNGMDKDDWRRNNVNTLVKETYDTVKSLDENMQFGVSVFGIWANKGSDTPVEGSNSSGLESYSSLYCDSLAWAKGGYVDYIAPQNYWSTNEASAPFDEIARWWNANLDGTGVDLYMGHAAYKSEQYKDGEIYRQVDMCRSLSSYKGSIFYGYDNIANNRGGVADDIKKLNAERIKRTQAVSNQQEMNIAFPDNNSYLNTQNTYIIGSCDSGYPLTVNGQAVSKTLEGYFGIYAELKKGQNDFSFVQNGKEMTLTLYYDVKNNSSGTSNGTSYKKLDAFEISSPYPSLLTWLEPEEKLEVSCVAPSDCVVTATLGTSTVVLSPTVNPPDQGDYMYEKYTGTIIPDTVVNEGEIKSLGEIIFTAERDGEKAELTGPSISQKGDDAYSYAQVKYDYTHTKISTSSSFYDDFLPSSKGMRDYIVDMTNGYCKLRFGGYVSAENIDIVYDRPLLLNTILTTAVEVNDENTSNNLNNSTDIRFGVTENIPVDVDFRGENGAMRIIIYNSDTSIIPSFDVPANPLIKSISGQVGTRENMIIYTVQLKNNKNFYGFNIVYEDGCMIVKLNNPQTLADGDKPLTGKRIVVDAGHGGSDIGAPGPGSFPEAYLNQAIATELVKELESLGAEVIQSRPDNNTVDLYERMDILNDECPDIAISVHHNSVAGSTNALRAKGFLALYSNNSGVSLTETISAVVTGELGRQERQPAYQKLAVARNHRFPSTLLEMCFISNVEEYQWSIMPGNYEKSAKAIAQGVLKYYSDQEKYLDY